MQTQLKTMVFVAVLALTTGPAAAQHHHLGHMAAFHHHLWHPWVVNSMSVYASPGYGGSGYGGYGYPAYPLATAYLNSVAATQTAAASFADWQRSLETSEQQYQAAAAAERGAYRTRWTERRERRLADRERHLERIGARPGRPADADPVMRNGEFVWPRLLLSDDYQAEREAIERLFTEGAHDGDFGRGSQFALQVERLSDDLATELKRHLKEVNANDHIDATRFVKNLVKLARRPAEADRVASR